MLLDAVNQRNHVMIGCLPHLHIIISLNHVTRTYRPNELRSRTEYFTRSKMTKGVSDWSNQSVLSEILQ